MAKHGLDALKKSWTKAKADAKEFQNPHFNDGHYLTKISVAKTGESKKGLAQLIIDFAFMEGEYAGKSKRTWWNLDPSNEQGLAITIGMLMRLGLDPEPETLEDDIKQLIGKIVRIQIVTTTAKDGVTEYQNVRVEKVMGVDPDTAEVAPAPKAVEEPEPETEEEEEEAEEEEVPAKHSKAKGSEDPEETEEEEEVEEPAEEADEEEGVDITVGMKVAFTKKDGSELTGTIEEIDEENGKVVVKSKVDGSFKKFRVDVDRLSAL